MISGHNDDKKTAHELANLLSGMPVHVNIIPVNKIENGVFTINLPLIMIY